MVYVLQLDFFNREQKERAASTQLWRYILRLNMSISPDKYRQVRYPRVKLLL